MLAGVCILLNVFPSLSIYAQYKHLTKKTLPSLANRAVRVRTGRTGPVVPLNVIRPYRAAPLGCLVRGCTCSMKVFGAYTIDCPTLASISILPAASRCRAVTHNDEAA